MDPLSALILAGIFAMLVVRAATERGPLRRRWRRAVERRTVKAEQKQAARMELLRDNGPANVAKYKARLERRAKRWDKINKTVAGWGAASWEAAKKAAAKPNDALDEAWETEHDEEWTSETFEEWILDTLGDGTWDPLDEGPVWNENERRDQHDEQDEQDVPIDPVDHVADAKIVNPADEPDQSAQDAKVIPPRPGSGECLWGKDNPNGPACTNQRVPDRPFCAAHLTENKGRSATPQPDSGTTKTNADNNGEGMTARPETATEITNLTNAIEQGIAAAAWANRMSSILFDIIGQLHGILKGSEAEAAQRIMDKESLVNLGFLPKVTDWYDTAAEALNLAADMVKALQVAAQAVADQMAKAGKATQTASNVLRQQVGLIDAVSAAKGTGAGVAKKTEAYE